jgi:MFS family permease
VSNAGTWLQNITIPYVLFDLTDSEAWVGLATFCLAMPIMLLGPLGGALADRHERRRVLMLTQGSMAVVAFGLFWYWSSGGRSVLLLLAFTAASGVLNGLNIPSWQSFVPGLVPRHHLTSAVTLNSLQFNAARALGPAVGGVVLATLGPSWAFLLNAMSFAFVILALQVVRARYEGPRYTGPRIGVVRGFVEAIDYIKVHRAIGVAIVVAIAVGFFGNPLVQFTVVFAEDIFDRGELGVGLLSASLGAGAVLTAPIAGSSRWRRSQLVQIALFTYGASVLCFALSPNIVLASIAVLCAGGSFLIAISVTNAAVQVIVSDRMRGRVMAARVMSFTAAYPIGSLLQGALAQVFGARWVVAAAGCCLLVVAMSMVPHPERLQLLDSTEPAE